MGLYIPGTSIRGCGVGGPIGCGCPCYNWYNGRCQVVNKDVGDPSVLGFPDFCPIVHVQSPHGRCIDADLLRADWLENGENEYVYDTNAFLDSIDAALTIIPAEEVNK